MPFNGQGKSLRQLRSQKQLNQPSGMKRAQRMIKIISKLNIF